MTISQQDYIISFEAWIQPSCSLHEAAGMIGQLYSVALSESFTDRFDEYPAYAIDVDDLVFIRLMGVPQDIEGLITRWPSEFSEKDRNYALCISCHTRLPCVLKNGFNLPYKDHYEFLMGSLSRLCSSGLRICKSPSPFVQIGTEMFSADNDMLNLAVSGV